MTSSPINTMTMASPARRSLILAGGGMRVAYQAGVLRALEEAGLRFDHADGTSGGTINLAMLLSGQSPAEMCERWRTLNVKDFVSFLPVAQYLNAAHLPALGDADGVVDKVFPHLGINLAKINGCRNLTGTFNVCNYSRKVNEVVTNDRLTMDLLVAGISLPIFMPAVEHAGELYMDSVWIRDANCIEAVRRGADELWIVWCIGNHGRYLGGAFNQYVHMIELSANGKLFDEFDRINDINRWIAAGVTGTPVYDRTRPAVVHVIRPRHPLPLDPDYYNGRIDAATLIDQGYQDAWTYLASRKPAGIALTPKATQMADPTVGISFRETMAGPLAMNAIDPHQVKNGPQFIMNATVTIHDLDRFIAHPEHAGSITGHISYPPLGENLPAKTGTFNLFAPADDPKMKYMVYELGFAADGQDYYMAGKKEVWDDWGLDMWTDTTTLFTRLHQGRDATAPVVGAGVLTLSFGKLLKMLPTMTVFNAPTAISKAAALAKFGKFFAGEIYDTYGITG